MKKTYLLILVSIFISFVSYSQSHVVLCGGSLSNSISDTLPGTWSNSNDTLVPFVSSDLYNYYCEAMGSGFDTIRHYTSTGIRTWYVTVQTVMSESHAIRICVGDTDFAWVESWTGISMMTAGDTLHYPVTGTWVSLDTTVFTITPHTGVIRGVSGGEAGFINTTVEGCSASGYEMVDPASFSVIVYGNTSVCEGSTITLSDSTPVYYWLSSSSYWHTSNSHATISSSGVVTGVSAGLDTIKCTVYSACDSTISYYVITINPLPTTGSIIGATNVCIGSTISLSDSVSGGVWSVTDSNASITGGVVTGILSGIDTIKYSTSNTCGTRFASHIITVNPHPVVTASVIRGCNVDTLISSGGTTYSWIPTIGLSCSTCTITTVSPYVTTIYTVTGTTSGCTNIATVTVDGNRIFGHVSFSDTIPSSLNLKVWLIQYNPIDSSLTALDSTLTCIEGITPYYEFYDKPAGNYMVKAKLNCSIPGTTGYVPTYGFTSPHWDSANTITHTISSDSLNINMIYGTVPSGPGFIGGLIVMGAGRGTSGEVPAPNILVYLEDTLQHILTYTYTNSTGAYSFNGIAYGNYVIYPTDYKYYTTPSTIITIDSTNPADTIVNFKKHTTLGTITPFIITLNTENLNNNNQITCFPNPASNKLILEWNSEKNQQCIVDIIDILGQNVFNKNININQGSGSVQLDILNFSNGIYILNIKSSGINYVKKIEIFK